MIVALDTLRDTVYRALKNYGYRDDEAHVIEEVLLYAQLRDNNQGIVKLIGKGIPKDPAAGEIAVVRQTKLSALLDGQKNAGMVVLNRAVDLCIERTRAYGFGVVGTYNTATSTGAIGYYARRLATSGYLGFVFAGSPPTVAAHGSYQPIFGTNPIAVGIPTSGDPMVFDMTTAAMAFYGLIEASTAGRSIPENTAYDNEGRPTTDPKQAMEGALLPFDRGRRGAGLALVIEVLTGPLVQAAFAGVGDSWGNWGNLVFAWDPELLVDRHQFEEDVSTMIRQVKATRRLPGVDEILVPGERGDRLSHARISAGKIEIEDSLYAALQRAAKGD